MASLCARLGHSTLPAPGRLCLTALRCWWLRIPSRMPGSGSMSW
eukprot:jgi/Astpho2/4931/e_gw1.00070.48.1_t